MSFASPLIYIFFRHKNSASKLKTLFLPLIELFQSFITVFRKLSAELSKYFKVSLLILCEFLCIFFLFHTYLLPYSWRLWADAHDLCLFLNYSIILVFFQLLINSITFGSSSKPLFFPICPISFIGIATEFISSQNCFNNSNGTK